MTVSTSCIIWRGMKRLLAVTLSSDEYHLLHPCVSFSLPGSFWLTWEREELVRRGRSQQCRKLTWHSKFVSVLCCCFSARCFQAEHSLLCDIKHIRKTTFALLHSPSEQVQLGSSLNRIQATGDRINPRSRQMGERKESQRETLWGC